MSFCANTPAAANRLGEIANKIFSVETVCLAKFGVFDNRPRVSESAVFV
jgi:hypothetical protein